VLRQDCQATPATAAAVATPATITLRRRLPPDVLIS
jgi:hypothetical protein